MPSRSRRKSGTSSASTRRISASRRDKEILNFLLEYRQVAEDIAAKCSEPRQPLSVYSKLPFPLLNQRNGERMPRWDQLTPWLKVHIAIICFSEWKHRFLTFTVHLEKITTAKWVSEGPDICRTRFRDRMRKYLRSSVDGEREFVFAIEGLSTRSKSATRLHIHGAVVIKDHREEAKIKEAIHKAAGQGLRGKPKEPKALKTEMFYGGDATWGDYILKFVDTPDVRLAKRRIGMSISTISSARAFWNLITGRWGNEEVCARLKVSMMPPERDHHAKSGRDYRKEREAILKRFKIG